IMTGTPGSAPVTAQPLTRNRTVSDWVKQLLPAGWQFRQENAATPALRTRIASWSANDQWTRSLNRLLVEQHLWGHLDWKNRTLTVTTSPAAPATDSSPQATAPASTTSSAAASPVKTRPSPAPVSPFRNSTATGKSSPSHLKVSGQSGDIPVVFLSEARNLTTEQWVSRLLPDGWKTDWRTDRQARQHRTDRLAVNDQWTRALDALLTRQNLWGHLDWNSRTLVITPTAAAPLSTSGTGTAKATGATVQAPAPLPAPGWTAEKGATLRQTLTRWAAQVPCTVTGHQPGQTWSVVWSASVDYPIDAAFTLRGGWKDVLTQTFDLYSRANTPLLGTLFEKQCILSVRDRKD
ncbi:TPA: TcpQ domain-containing protein, partial [Escherichia coli]